MKNVLSILVISVFFAACTGGSSDKKGELDNLIKQQADITSKIKKLKDELALSDSTGGSSKGTLVKVSEVIPQAFSHFIEVQAHVDGDEDVMVSPEMMGNVVSISVKAGDKVIQGQVLASLDDKMMQQSIGEMQTQLDLVTQLYNKQKSLWDQKIGSEVQFIQAKTNKEGMEKRMAALQEQWKMSRIKSPITGTVDAVNIKVGQSVAPGMPAIHVVNLSALKVKAEVAESYISKVQRGNQVLIYFPDLNKEIKGIVNYSGSAISDMNRTFNVDVVLNPRDGIYHPNMIAVLKIVDYTSPQAMVVPVKTIQSGTDGHYVFVAASENGKSVARRQQVQPGITYNGITEIIGGIKAGDKVVIVGYADLVDGEELKF